MRRSNVDVNVTPPINMVTANLTEVNRALMRKQLALLLHAEQCRRQEHKGMSDTCLIRHCSVMRQVLGHVERCLLEDCNVAHCRSSKMILKHFRICTSKLCDVCCAVQKPTIKPEPPSTSSNVDLRNGPLCDPSVSGPKQDISTLNGIKSSNSPCCETITSCTPSFALNGEVHRSNRNSFHLSDQQRELAMKKFVNVALSIFNTPNSTAYSDPRMKQFLDHVKRMEKDIFMKSKSTEEYYALLTACCQNIHSEFKEKSRLRGSRSSDNQTEQTDLIAIQTELQGSEKRELSTTRISDSHEKEPTSGVCYTRKLEELEQTSTSPDRSTISTQSHSLGCTDSEHVDVKRTGSPMETKSFMSTDSVPLKENTTGSVEASQFATAKCDTDVKCEEVKPTPCSQFIRAVWYPNELQRYFLPIVERISKEKDAEPFLQPVDWESLEIFDYPQIVSHPMDLSTIRKKLEDREYKDPWSVADDFWLMLNNAWLYNKKTSKVYKTCTRLAEIFEAAIDPVMQSLGFCCGREYYYLPPPLTCLTPKFCTIQRDAVYYVYKNENHTPGLLEQKYTVCERCYNEANDEIRLDSESSTVVTVQKSHMEKCKNDRKEKEPFVFCRKCGRKWHRVCAIHMDEIWPEGFTCDRCMNDYSLKRPENRFTARRLATCKLSNFLEKRVNDFLKKKGHKDGDVIIRVLAAADKTVEVKPGMRTRFCETGEMPESFPYRVKAIFAFQDIDGHEVCFFGLHVQEYGSECPYPNTRRVYLAYLDSVYFFRPKQFRTDVYHELLVGYIQYAKLLGYTVAHIWACPPSEGDDYIFHMHPTDQKIPKPKRLQEWYQKMLKKALLERIVVDYKDICQDACESRLVSPTELAYFEGDFWPNTLEELFKEMDEEDARRKREQEALARDDDEDETRENVQTRENDANPGKKKAKKRKLKRNASMSLTGKRKRLSGTSPTDMANEVARRVYEIMEKHKENFFVIRLHPQNTVAALPPIKDPDPLINSDLMECRGAFLERAREKHLEFSSIRRAKYSTLAMLYDLHTENRQPLAYTCNVCSVQLETPWHCRQCVEYDLCPRCYEMERHPHPMEQISLGLDDNGRSQDPDSEAAAMQESGRDKLTRLVKALSHCCSCRDANCRVFACKTMKSSVKHFQAHAATAGNQCSACRSLSYICYYHSKSCHEVNCLVPLCRKLKDKMLQQQKQQRLEQTQMLRRRMATMQRYNSMTPNHQPPSQPPQQSTSECVSSPVPNTMQSSPYPPTAITTCTSFTALSSPLSRTPSSLPSPQQAPPLPFHQSVPGCLNQQLHSKQVGPVSVSVVSSSPNLTSPQHISYGPPPSTSPFYGTPQPQQPCVIYGDSVDLCKSEPMCATAAYTTYQSMSRSQSMLQATGPPAPFPVSVHANTLPHHLERSQSAQFCSSSGSQHVLSANHPQLTRQSPCSSQHGYTPSSPRCQQPYVSHVSMASEPLPYAQPGVFPSASHLSPEDQLSSYPHTKHPLQRYATQMAPSGDMSNPPQPQSGMSPVWRASVPITSCVGGTANIYAPGPPLTQQRCSNSPCTPNVTIARPAPIAGSSAPHGCATPPLSSIGVSSEDVYIVKQTYSELRQRGAPVAEFSHWLNANPHYLRAWQFIQQSHMYAQQQQQQQQQQQLHQPPMGSVSNSNVTGLCVQQQPSNFPINQAQSQAGVTTRPMRHATSVPGPMMQPQSQQWPSAMPQQQHQQQQQRSRPTTLSSQPQFSYYPQSNKLGCSTSPIMQPQQQMNPQSTAPRCLGPMPTVPHAPTPTQVPISPPANTLNRSGSMNSLGPQQQQQFMVARSGGVTPNSSSMSSMVMVPGGSVGPVRTHSQYSSVMLSQLLGPCQTGSGQPTNPSISASFPMNSLVPPSQLSQTFGRVDFATPSTVLSSNPLYPDGGSML